LGRLEKQKLNGISFGMAYEQDILIISLPTGLGYGGWFLCKKFFLMIQ